MFISVEIYDGLLTESLDKILKESNIA